MPRKYLFAWNSMITNNIELCMRFNYNIQYIICYHFFFWWSLNPTRGGINTPTKSSARRRIWTRLAKPRPRVSTGWATSPWQQFFFFICSWWLWLVYVEVEANEICFLIKQPLTRNLTFEQVIQSLFHICPELQKNSPIGKTIWLCIRNSNGVWYHCPLVFPIEKWK